MTVNWYVSTDNPKKINKSLGEPIATSPDIMPFEAVDLDSPKIILAYNSSLLNVNYAELDGRYYFVDEPILDTGNRMIFTMHPDLLMTYQSGILALPAIADRTQVANNQFSSYLVDTEQRVYTFKTICTRLMHTFQYGSDYILITAG